MLSLVPLTGYGGQISLAPMAFAGIGAIAMGEWGGNGNPLGLVAAFVLPAIVGALVALPALRLRGIYLALATLAFAVFMEQVVFSQDKVFPSGSRSVDRLRIGPIHFESDRAYMCFLAVVFAIVGLGDRVAAPRPVRPTPAGHEGQPGGVRDPRHEPDDHQAPGVRPLGRHRRYRRRHARWTAERCVGRRSSTHCRACRSCSWRPRAALPW